MKEFLKVLLCDVLKSHSPESEYGSVFDGEHLHDACKRCKKDIVMCNDGKWYLFQKEWSDM